MKRYFTITSFAVFASTAAMGAACAQEFTPPRFEGLEQQQRNLEQQQLDTLEDERQRELFRPLEPGTDNNAAQSALRRMEIERRVDAVRLQGSQDRQRTARERAIETAKLPNRRISAASTLVVSDPERYVLPPAPDGQYYARLNGRFVLVDGASELVVKVLDLSPSDPTGDQPTPPLPPPAPPIAQSVGPRNGTTR